MNIFLQDLYKKRKQYLDAVDANEGDINLDIFEDFYPDKAHFIFELLQNAEDTGATKATIILTEESCSFEHNGTRVFGEADVRAITGIGMSTKKKEADTIGKFGIGFKSVFLYTKTPIVLSGKFFFKIFRLVLPEEIDHDSTVGTKTRFVLPFNNPEMIQENAYAEIKSGLSELAETTLLFLSHLESIHWKIGQRTSGEVQRIQHPENHFEVLKKIDGKTTASSHFLKFDQPVPRLGKKRVAVAYVLDFLPNVQSFDPSKPLTKQLRIVPADPGRVAVFFPAEKETSRLRFHLHAPFVPELSRASIKETPDNEPLFQQLATLAAASLHDIRDLGLLSSDFLRVLPNPQDSLPRRYECIHSAIVEAMDTEPLTPTHSKSHAPAEHLLQANAPLKDLLSKGDLKFLVDYDKEPPQWAVGAKQKNNDIDRFLVQLKITDWGIEKFIELIVEKAGCPYGWSKPDDEFSDWLAGKPVDWHQQLYALLYDELEKGIYRSNLNRLEQARIVRLAGGGYGLGSECFFPGGGPENNEGLPRVDEDVYTSGKNKRQQEHAKKFLEKIGVREVGEVEQVEAILKQRYTKESKIPDENTYLMDLKRFVAFVEQKTEKANIFSGYNIFECDDANWRTPDGVFLDKPYADTGLHAYYDRLGEEDAKRFALADSYQNRNICPKNLAKFAEAVGVQTRLEISKTSCGENPDWPYLSSVEGKRNTSPIDEDYKIKGLKDLLEKPSEALSKLIWRTMRSLPKKKLKATYRKSQRHGSYHADSQLVHQLKNAKWVPQGEGLFVRPADASRNSLPEGFSFDPGWDWIKAIHFEEKIVGESEEHRLKQAAAELGFSDDESLKRAQHFAELPLKDQKRVLANYEDQNFTELPEHEPNDPERRVERVAKGATQAPMRQTKERTRSVSIGLEAAKKEAYPYLLEQYTNADREMICQVCKAPLPFKLDDGTSYFEKVEFLPELKKLHHQNYLALCPNHAAMFQYANGSRELISEMFAGLTENELEIILARKPNTIYFTKTHIADLKTVMETDAAEIQSNDDQPDPGDDGAGE